LDKIANYFQCRTTSGLVGENVQEVETLIPIADEIQKLSFGRVQCEFASQDAFYCQGVDDVLRKAEVTVCSLPYPVRLSKSVCEKYQFVLL